MYRKAFFAMVMVCCPPAAAYANPIISLDTWTILPTSGQSVDAIKLTPIAVMIETPAGFPNQIVRVDLALTSGPDGLTPFSGPLIESVDLIGPGTLFAPNNTGQADLIGLPSLHSLSSTLTVPPGSHDASGPAVLAFLSFDATGVAPGLYPIFLKNLVIDAPNEVPTDVLDPLGVSLSPTLIDGSVTMSPTLAGSITVIPEPGSITLALLAAGGLCALAIRHHRKCGRRKR